MKLRKKMNRTGKFWSISIALVSLLYFGCYTSANAQEDTGYTNEKTNEVNEKNVDYHNLDYRNDNNKNFGKEDKLIEENGMNSKAKNANAGTEDGTNTDAHTEDAKYREKKHEGVQDGIYQNSDPYRSDSQPVGQMNAEKENASETTHKSDSTDQDNLKHSYGLNQEIINEEPNQDQLENSQKVYKKYEDALLGIATYQVRYPDMIFDYEYDADGQLKGVTVSGIESGEDMNKASEWLIEAYKLSDSLKYRKDKNGVYYNVDERARFKDGKQELYQKLRGNLSYPDDAEDRGIEGVVQLKFVVDRFGDVHNVQAEENIDAADWIVDQMVQEAKNSFERINQDWIPGEIHNIEVPQWVTIPVQFSIKLPPSLQML